MSNIQEEEKMYNINQIFT